MVNNKKQRGKIEIGYSKILDSLPEGCQIIGFDWRYLYINDAADIHNKRPKEELLGKKYMDIWPGIERTEIFRIIKRCMEEQIPYHAENEFVFQDGTRGWFDLSIHCVPEGVFILSTDITGQKQAEDLIRIERERLANILEGTNVGTWEWNIQTGETIFNERWANIIGYTLDEISPVSIKTWEKYSHPEDLEKSNEQLSKVFNKEIDYYDIECRMKHKDGNWIWVQDRGKIASWTPDGKPLWMSGTHTDITERKQMEEALHASEEKFAKAFHSSLQGLAITVLDDNRVIEVNDAYTDIFGYTRKEIIGHTTSNLGNWVNPDDRTRLMNILKEKGFIHNEEADIRTKSGDIKTLLISTQLIDMEGKACMLSAFYNITDRKKAERALHESEEKYRLIVENQTDFIIEIDNKSKVLYVSPSYCEMFGISENEISGKKLVTLVHKEDRELTKEAVRKIYSPPYYSYVEQRSKSKYGWRWFAWSIKSILDKEGNVKKIVSTGRDISDRKKVEEELIHDENLLNQVGEISKIGGWEMDMARGGKAKWTKGTYDIIKIGYNESIPGYNEHINYYLPEYRQMIREKMQRLSTKKEALHFQAQLKTVKNNIIWVEVFGEAITEDGKVVKLIGTVQDITDRKKAVEDLEISHKKTTKILEETIKTLSAIVEIRDPYTSGHQQKVAEIAAFIAIEMGLEQDIVNGVRTAAIIHDIGKIIIPASILSKPGKINEIEYNMIKAHPETGYDMLKNIDFPWPVAKIILQHHERINGTGYPRNLKDKEIMIEAKLLAIADVLEAMTSHRPYRPALGLNQAVKELEKNKGILYDSEIVDTCKKLIRDKVLKFHRNQQN